LVVTPLYPGAQIASVGNGLRAIVEEVEGTRTVSLGLWARAGSRDDPDAHPGLAHFIEHLLFKGTDRRDATRISREIDALGGHVNGATGKESTFYYVDVPADGFAKALDVLADLVQHPRLDPSDLDLERGVVLEEIRGRDDDPEQRAYDLFQAGLWHEGHPLGRSVLGDRETIASVDRETLVETHRRAYDAPNLGLVVCGAVRAEDVYRACEGLFDGETAGVPRPARALPRFKEGRARHVAETHQAHVYVGLPGTDASDLDRYALEVVNDVLGGGTSSRLFRIIREERGLAYAVSSGATYYSDAGTWTIYAGVSPERVDEVVGITLDQLKALQRDGVSPEEFALTKAKLRGNLILGLETNANRMFRLGHALALNREILSPDEVIARVETVSAEDVAGVIERFVRPEQANLTIVGPDQRVAEIPSSD